MRLTSLLVFAIAGLFLTACAKNPPSYLPAGTQPIVNVEADLAEWIEVDAQPQSLKLHNRTTMPLNIGYKLFWYDVDGVTQTLDPSNRTAWHNFWLEPQAKTEWQFTPPTPESVNYRLYLRHRR